MRGKRYTTARLFTVSGQLDTVGHRGRMMPPPRLLIIAFHYPPSNTSGTLRTLKFTKYLGGCGWNSSVVTVPARCYQSIDSSLSAQIPSHVRVHAATCFDAKAVFSIWGKYPAFVATPDRFVSWLPFGVYRVLRAIRDEDIRVLLSTSPVPTAHLIALSAKLISGIPWIADFRDPWGPESDTRARLPCCSAVAGEPGRGPSRLYCRNDAGIGR